MNNLNLAISTGLLAITMSVAHLKATDVSIDTLLPTLSNNGDMTMKPEGTALPLLNTPAELRIFLIKVNTDDAVTDALLTFDPEGEKDTAIQVLLRTLAEDKTLPPEHRVRLLKFVNCADTRLAVGIDILKEQPNLFGETAASIVDFIVKTVSKTKVFNYVNNPFGEPYSYSVRRTIAAGYARAGFDYAEFVTPLSAGLGDSVGLYSLEEIQQRLAQEPMYLNVEKFLDVKPRELPTFNTAGFDLFDAFQQIVSAVKTSILEDIPPSRHRAEFSSPLNDLQQSIIGAVLNHTRLYLKELVQEIDQQPVIDPADNLHALTGKIIEEINAFKTQSLPLFKNGYQHFISFLTQKWPQQAYIYANYQMELDIGVIGLNEGNVEPEKALRDILDILNYLAPDIQDLYKLPVSEAGGSYLNHFLHIFCALQNMPLVKKKSVFKTLLYGYENCPNGKGQAIEEAVQSIFDETPKGMAGFLKLVYEQKQFTYHNLFHYDDEESLQYQRNYVSHLERGVGIALGAYYHNGSDPLDNRRDMAIAALFETIENDTSSNYERLYFEGRSRKGLSVKRLVENIKPHINDLGISAISDFVKESNLAEIYGGLGEFFAFYEEHGLTEYVGEKMLLHFTDKGIARIFYDLGYFLGNFARIDEVLANKSVPDFIYPPLLESSSTDEAMLPYDFRNVAEWRVYFEGKTEIDLSCQALNDADLEAISKALDGNTTVRTLDLSYNEITKIGEGTLVNMPNLTTLKLCENEITILGDDFGKALPRLQNLHIRTNNLTQLPENFGENLSALKLLTVAGNKLTFLPYSVYRGLPEIKVLDITQNNITRLPLPVTFGVNMRKLRKMFVDEGVEDVALFIPSIKSKIVLLPRV